MREGSHGAPSVALVCSAALRLPERLPGAYPRVCGGSEREKGWLGGPAGEEQYVIRSTWKHAVLNV